MAAFSTQNPVLSSERSKTCGMLNPSSSQTYHEAFSVPHGVRVVQNGRPMLEDAFSQAVIDAPSAASGCLDGAAVSSVLGQQQPLSFFGVYDGHGGHEVAHHAAAKLHQHFQQAYKQLATAAQLAGAGGSGNTLGSTCSNNSTIEEMLCEHWHSNSSSTGDSAASLADLLGPSEPSVPSASTDLTCSSPSSSSNGSPTCQQVWATISGPASGVLPSGTSLKQQQQQHPSRASRVVVQALREAFLRTDAELAGTEVGEVVGTTAVTAVLAQEELFIGHTGDSRAVLCRKGVAVPLTSDHKPGRADEMARVTSLGGKVVYKAGSHRVMGLLAMSRALGDHFLRPYVIPDPEVLCIQRCPDDELLILATDGLWDVLSCQEATTLALRSTIRARQRGASASAACRVGASVLVRGAIERGSRDNITVAVIDLRRGGQEESFASVASVLASQCSSDLSGFVPGGGGGGRVGGGVTQQGGGVGVSHTSRKRRSESGNGDDGDEQQQQPLALHSSICTGHAFHEALSQHHNHHTAALVGLPGDGHGVNGSSSGGGGSSNGRRHTSSACEPGVSAASPANAGTGVRSPGVAWGWSLQGLHILPHSQDNPTSSIRALAQAAAAAVAAFSGTMSDRGRCYSGIPRDVAAAGSGSSSSNNNVSAAAAAREASGVAAAAVVAPATPSLSDLLSMQSAPALRQGSVQQRNQSAGGGKPPLPHISRS